LAQTTTTAPAGTPPPPAFSALQNFFPIIVAVAILYFFVFGSKKKQEKQRQEMLNQVQKGDRVQTIGGILGTVVEARDTEVVVKVDETSNTKIKFTRSAIHRVITDEKTDSK
jgi:preprotein translocase subunit YajC